MAHMVPALVVLASLAVVPIAQAQEIEIGSPVRVRLERIQLLRDDAGAPLVTDTITGRLAATEEGALTVRVGRHSRTVDVPASGVRGVDVRAPRSRSRGALRGAGYGLLVGATVGAAIGFASGRTQCDGGCIVRFSAAENAAMAGCVVGVIGALAGTVGGSLAPGHRWRNAATIPVTKRVALKVSGTGSLEPAAALSIRF